MNQLHDLTVPTCLIIHPLKHLGCFQISAVMSKTVMDILRWEHPPSRLGLPAGMSRRTNSKLTSPLRFSVPYKFFIFNLSQYYEKNSEQRDLFLWKSIMQSITVIGCFLLAVVYQN